MSPCFALRLRLSAETVCSKDSIKGLAPSVVASGKLGVEEAFNEAETLVFWTFDDDDDVVVVSDFRVGDVNIDFEDTEDGDDIAMVEDDRLSS